MRALTLKEVALVLNIDKMTAYKYALEERIPATRVGNNWNCLEEVLEKWLTSRGVKFYTNIAEKKMIAEEAKKRQESSAGITMVRIKGGTFDMGDNFGDGNIDERPVHRVSVDDFFLSETPVTQTQWEAVLGNNPSKFKGPDRPVENISWNDVQEFLKGLNERTGDNFRLPTEAEWEYAAREGGKKIKYGTGKNELNYNDANYDNHYRETTPVKKFPPNALGLYDMSGNVWEWCADWYDENYYKNSPQNNPRGPLSGKYRVLRGGSWYYFPWDGRVSFRRWNAPYFNGFSFGFRCAW